MRELNIAIVGITGIVGLQFLKGLEEQNIPVNHLYFFASKASAGMKIPFKGREFVVEELTAHSFEGKAIDFSFFTAGAKISAQYADLAAKTSIVIDNSTYRRMDPSTPLVVPEVNAHAMTDHPNFIACPNCSTIQAVVALAPLHQKYGLKRVVVSTYQAVSGSGKLGIVDLLTGIEHTYEGVKALNGYLHQKDMKVETVIDGMQPAHDYDLATYDHPIAFNVIPYIDKFEANGYTREEMKVINETKKIMALPEDFPITCTAVRVPVINVHSESINIEFEKDFDLEELKAVLAQAPGIVLDETPMPLNHSGKDPVAVGRIRRDFSVKSGINLFLLADNIRKGAATNALQIIQALTKEA